MGQWNPSKLGLFRYVVERRVFSDAFGSGYEYAKDEHGVARRFWKLEHAQTLADKLNEDQPHDPA